MNPMKIELSWIVVSDLIKAKRFYTEVLGLKVHESSEEYGWLEVQTQVASYLARWASLDWPR